MHIKKNFYMEYSNELLLYIYWSKLSCTFRFKKIPPFRNELTVLKPFALSLNRKGVLKCILKSQIKSHKMADMMKLSQK